MAEACGDKDGSIYHKVLDLLNLCHRVYDSVNILSVTHMSKVQMLLKHPDFVKTAGYSAKEVIDTFNLPEKAVNIFSAYWIYVGHILERFAFYYLCSPNGGLSWLWFLYSKEILT